MKLISLNIEYNKHDELVLPFVKKERPDIVCLQELLEEKFEFYKKELAMDGVFQTTNYADSVVYKDVAGKKEGVAIFAKKIIKSGSINDSKDNKLVWVDAEDDEGLTFKFLTTHLPVTTKGEVTPYQLEVIDDLIKKLQSFNDFVLCGDMNAPRGHASFARFTNKYKDNIPPEYKTSIDPNLHRVKGIQFMVDGLFTTPNYIASGVRLVDGVSDHMAIVAEIVKK